MKLFHIYDNVNFKIMLISTAVQLGNVGLLVNFTRGAQIPITIYEEVIVEMRVGLNIVSDYFFFFSPLAQKRSVFPEVDKAKILVILK